MKNRFAAISILVLLSVSCASVYAQEKAPRYAEKYRDGVPPVGTIVQFEHEGSLPPKPKGMEVTNTQLEFKEDPAVLSDEQVKVLRQAALSDIRVQAALGKRFVFVTAGPTELEKGKGPVTDQPLTTMHFYSYSNNRAFTVQMTGEKVLRVVPARKGYQPPEGREEVEAAAEIVKADPRFTKSVADLFARGIVAPSEDGNRQLYLLFYKQPGLKRGAAIFQALVDMTAGKVISAHEVSQ